MKRVVSCRVLVLAIVRLHKKNKIVVEGLLTQK